MAPAGTKKGSKAAAAAAARERRSTSRQSTPLSPVTADTGPPTPLVATPTSAAAAPPQPATPALPKETAYIHAATASLVSNDASLETLIDRATGGFGGGTYGGLNPPAARELHTLHDRIKGSALKFMSKRGEASERSMRQLVQKRKDRAAIEAEREMARVAEEQAARVKEEEGASERKKKKEKGSKKRNADDMEGVEMEGVEGDGERRDSLPSVGAHGVARQDGVGVHEGAPAPPSPIISPKRDAPDLMDTADSDVDSEASRTDAPSAAPLYERAFGKDPTLFDDPTIYDIRDITDDMTEDEKREILNVAQWPESDLKELTAGDPPDEDFSNAKPSNQINFSTFQTYVEPYIRAFTEEDVAFLKERGDRVTPYLIPQRGARTYKEVWASEDGMDGVAPPRKQGADPNEARGSMEDMNGDTVETDEVSMGPIMNRLLSIIRPAPSMKKDNSAPPNDTEDAEGDITMLNGDADASQDALPTLPGAALPDDISAATHKPATYLPPDAPRPSNLLTADYASLDARALQELRHIGFLGPNDVPDFAGQNDDEVSARLRTLQHELRRVSRTNNIRKLRVLELTEERMAMQEYANIADDLDNQVNAAYLKRNRSLAKPGSKKGGGSANRPGASGGVARGLAGVGGVGGRGVSDGVRALMQKRRDWIEMVGPVVGFGRPPIPGDGETIFDEGSLRRLERVEREAEVGEGEGE